MTTASGMEEGVSGTMRHEMAIRRMTVADLAWIIGRSPSCLIGLRMGRTNMTARMARDLGVVFPTVAPMEWMRLDYGRRLAEVEARRARHRKPLRRSLEQRLAAAEAVVDSLRSQLEALSALAAQEQKHE